MISAAIRDISERKYMVAQQVQAEEALRRAYDELQSRVGELAETNQLFRHEWPSGSALRQNSVGRSPCSTSTSTTPLSG